MPLRCPRFGGSYPEPESRLSDIALEWMCREAIAVPDGLLCGPIFVDGEKMDGTAHDGSALHLYPRADGPQHCEVAGMRDTLDAFAAKLPRWRWLQNLIARQNWKTKMRVIQPEAVTHPTVAERFDLAGVVQCSAGKRPYRPAALAGHHAFENRYPTEEGAS